MRISLISIFLLLIACQSPADTFTQKNVDNVDDVLGETIVTEEDLLSEPPLPLTEEQAIRKCVELCMASRRTLDLDSQCLGDLDEVWVCDVAHDPREEKDNYPENQCSSFRDGDHSHFVEVDSVCNFIRAH